jgi:transcriptional regulator of aromatic amino acid metabolism
MPSRTDVFQKTPISSLRSKLLELPLLQSEVSAEIIDSKQCMVKLPQLLNVISHPMAILNEKAQVVLSNKALS